MNNKIFTSIIKTLCYSDIFDYPLNKSQIHKYLIKEKVSRDVVNAYLKIMVSKGFISTKSGCYFLNGKGNNVKLRIRRAKESVLKMKKAVSVASILSLIPSVRLVAVSGSLSMDNAEKRDDIDLFIITGRNSLWITRFMVVLSLLLSGIKRSRGINYGIDKICPNMFLSENSKALENDIYTAHEIVQMRILVNKNNAYEKFLYKNKNVISALPNSFSMVSFEKERSNKLISILDRIFYFAQFLYMKKYITKEIVKHDKAMFHPSNKKSFVTHLYEQKYKNYLQYIESVKSTKKEFSASLYTPGY